MVSYYNTAAMYRHQQAVSANGGQFHHSGSPMHSWYAGGYHHQGPQVGVAPAPSYCMQDEQQMPWHHPHVFHQDFQDFVAHSGMPIQQHHQQADHDSQLPASPPITVSGSELSSPGAVSGNISPPNAAGQTRPAQVRSPYEWIKKTSYQSQPNPGKTRTKDKYRVVYTDLQRIELEKEFTFNNKYITIRRKSELATNLGLSERQIKIWFQNRRAKERKQFKKRLEETQKDDPSTMQHLQQYEQKMQQMQQQNQHSNSSQLQMTPQVLPTAVPLLAPDYGMSRPSPAQN